MSTKTETATTTDRQEDRTPVIQLWGRLAGPPFRVTSPTRRWSG